MAFWKKTYRPMLQRPLWRMLPQIPCSKMSQAISFLEIGHPKIEPISRIGIAAPKPFLVGGLGHRAALSDGEL